MNFKILANYPGSAGRDGKSQARLGILASSGRTGRTASSVWAPTSLALIIYSSKRTRGRARREAVETPSADASGSSRLGPVA